VEIRSKSKVAAVRRNEIELNDGEKIVSSTLVWTAGISPNPILDRVPCEKERGRVKVSSTLEVEGADGLWALGDCALVPDPATGNYCPPTAQHASREGKVVARNIIATIYGRPKTRFSFKTLGALAAIGRRTGVARILGVNFSGFLAWFLWRGIYWSKLPRTEKKVRVAIDWALDVLFTKDFVQFLDQRALAHTQTETGTALWNHERLSLAGGVDAGNVIVRQQKSRGQRRRLQWSRKELSPLTTNRHAFNNHCGAPAA
jgi:NADH dehydrogenase